MNISRINEDIIEQIRKGSEKAFSDLFSTYYSYLNAVALCYLVDKEAGAEMMFLLISGIGGIPYRIRFIII